MNLQDASLILSRKNQIDVGRFYGDIQGLSLGAGLIYADIRAPIFNAEENIFETYETTGYVLTHECDIDQNNQRSFNDFVLICPIIPLEHLVLEHQEIFQGDEAFGAFLDAVSARLVSRVVYLPPRPAFLENGGVIYLNNITSAHISAFQGKIPVGAVTAYGLHQIDQAITNHLLRPKADRLSLQNEPLAIWGN